MNREEYINDYIERYKTLGKAGSGAGTVDKPDRIKRFGYNDNLTLLDYGCGWGCILSEINPKDYLGVDIVPQAIEIARQDYPERKFEVLKIGKLKTDVKDFAIALSVFTHARREDVDDCLQDIYRNIKKIAIIDFLEGSGDGHAMYWSKIDFYKKLKDNGFKVIDSFNITSEHGYIHTYLKCTK